MNPPLASATSLIALLMFDSGSASAVPLSLLAGDDCLYHTCRDAPRAAPMPTAFGITTGTVTGLFAAGGLAVQPGADLLATPGPTGIVPLTGTAARTKLDRGFPHGSITSSLATGVTFLDSDPVSNDAADAALSTLAYAYTPVSFASFGGDEAQTTAAAPEASDGAIVVTTLSASGVGATFYSLFRDTAVTPTPGSGDPAATSVSLGTLGLVRERMGYMTLKTTGSDAASIGPASRAASDPCVFTVALPSSTVGGSANLGILVTGKGVERESTTLTVYTDDSVAYGGAGDSFAYTMTVAVPEPMAIVTTGAGLAGWPSCAAAGDCRPCCPPPHDPADEVAGQHRP